MTLTDYELTAERESFDSALAHFYAGLEPSEAARTFLDSCASALAAVHSKGDRIALPIQFK